MKYRDYYKVLGVTRESSEKEIRDAFRKLARKHHPDRFPKGSAEQKKAEERFKEITEAHEVLSDREKRQRYDTLGANWTHGADFTPPSDFDLSSFFGGGGGRGRDPFGGGGFSDFFRTIFGSFGASQSGSRPREGAFGGRQGPFHAPSGHGQDVEATLELGLAEALQGGRKSVNLGLSGGGGLRTVEIAIPAGVRDGARLRLRGQGHPAMGGGEPGDLFLVVKLRPDERFELNGDDVITEVNLWPWQAVLGAEIQVPTLDGQAHIRIPPRTQAGSRLRLRGQGWPRPGGQRGNLFAVVRIRVPANPSSEELELYEQLSRAAGGSSA